MPQNPHHFSDCPLLQGRIARDGCNGEKILCRFLWFWGEPYRFLCVSGPWKKIKNGPSVADGA